MKPSKKKIFKSIIKEIKEILHVLKNIFACLFSVHNTISLSHHEQVCLMRLRFERYFSSLNILVHDVINLLYYKILHDPIIDRNEKIEEIKKILFDSRNNLLKKEEDNYKPVKISNAFSSNYIEYKSTGNKDKHYQLNIILMKLSHIQVT